MSTEQTLVLVKPDGVQRALAGSVISRLEGRGLRIVAMKMLQMSREMASQHYSAHVERPFFNDLVDFITSSPIIAMVLEGPNAVEMVRNTMGGHQSAQRQPGDNPGRPGGGHPAESGPRLGLSGVGGQGDSTLLLRRMRY